ncbi:interferon alpha-inducible protein 27-like protein 2A [Microcaecilia unicolor]|uniref:Interferon alpha-inducible protein 27-like protein 2A n=1 Tax=Microcaecilia unicolor TaxID=1415580 RepID=A0A6P7XVP7_9AMPH|nr:interferon alpha-inducible protein 27-like protein 2A [Microcaecilia unicolor]
MSDRNVHNAGFTPLGITRGSTASNIMANDAKGHGGGVPSGGATSSLQKMGARSSTHSSGFTSSGIAGGSKASSMMSDQARSHGGGVPKGSTVPTIQSVSMGGKGGKC